MKKKAIFAIILFSNVMSAYCQSLNGFDIEIFQNTKAWRLAKAVKLEDTRLIQELIQQDTSLLNLRENYLGFTLLYWSAFNEKEMAFETLLKLGGNIEIRTNNDETVLMEAASKHQTSNYVKLILSSRHANVNAIAYKSGVFQKSPLTSACKSGNLENVKFLVEAGANINFRGNSERQTIGYACPLYASFLSIYRNIEITKYLIIDKGANYKNALTFTVNGDSIYISNLLRDLDYPLHSKSYKIKMQIVSFLMKNGIDYRKEPIPDFIARRHNYNERYLNKY